MTTQHWDEQEQEALSWADWALSWADWVMGGPLDTAVSLDPIPGGFDYRPSSRLLKRIKISQDLSPFHLLIGDVEVN